MDFTDRSLELERLRRVSRRGGGALVVVWGRRRIGKTRLLLEWVREAGGLYFVADESAPAMQRRSLAETLARRFPGFAEVDYPDWRALLRRLGREAVAAPAGGPLVIDELPYLVNAAPELPSLLQSFVDHEARAAGLVVALAGSSQRMMQGLVLEANAPLFGRADEILRLGPLPAGHLRQALGDRDAVVCIETYALFGGVPRYWELAAPFEDARAAAEDLILDPLGALHDEPMRLLLEETPPAVTLRPLLDAIGAGAHRVSEIAGRIGQPATSLSRALTRLQEMELVQREIAFGEPERSSKRALYKLADPFLRAWWRLVGSRRSLLLQAPRRVRRRILDEAMPHLVAAAFEELCRRAVPALEARLGGQAFGVAGRYWGGDGPEWDVIAESADGGTLLVGECKWTGAAVTAAAVEKIARALAAKGRPAIRSGPRGAMRQVVFVAKRSRSIPPGGAGSTHVVDAEDVLSVLV